MDTTTAISPQALVRFMLYTDADRQSAQRIGAAIWMDFDTLFGPAYACGTEHELIFPEIDNAMHRYVVAMPPYGRKIPHPNGSDRQVLLVTLYLARLERYSLFPDITSDNLTVSMFPQ
ncbi:hypothetical protein [Spirosoma utsteinense]|uniref:Uncharacterized protein n=1 Tax=Spirosoma utsteinense TaxID=2585773 RepID=A0ABR6W5Y8_9BACT|nr:hypothetical protein [Spirosoma utsteinense]MBC3786346.1 hypothetical protein [Spirosoma utsteinense]MBC3791973.1 hypothetical protein [Spirosoma utsteinense]